MRAGATFQLPRHLEQHLWLVVSDPDADPEHVVMVSVTTVRPGSDLSCVLEPGDHRFIRHRSCIYYAEAKQTTLGNLMRLESEGLLVRHDPMSEPLLRRIRDNCRETTPIALRQILIDQKLIDDED